MPKNIASKIKYVDLLLIDKDVLRVDMSSTNSQNAEFITQQADGHETQITFAIDSLLFKNNESNHQQHVNKLKDCTISHVQIIYLDGTSDMMTMPWDSRHHDINLAETVFVSSRLITLLFRG